MEPEYCSRCADLCEKCRRAEQNEGKWRLVALESDRRAYGWMVVARNMSAAVQRLILMQSTVLHPDDEYDAKGETE